MPKLNFRGYGLVVGRLQDMQVIDDKGIPCDWSLKISYDFGDHNFWNYFVVLT